MSEMENMMKKLINVKGTNGNRVTGALFLKRAACRSEIRREMNHARLSGVPNGLALNHSGQSGTERFVCISCADGTQSTVTITFRVRASFADGTDCAVTASRR